MNIYIMRVAIIFLEKKVPKTNRNLPVRYGKGIVIMTKKRMVFFIKKDVRKNRVRKRIYFRKFPFIAIPDKY